MEMEMGSCVHSADVQRRRRLVYDFLDSRYPDWSQAVRWYDLALRTRKQTGADMKEARVLLRRALSFVADYGAIYRAWATLEAKHARNVGGARTLYEEWGRRCHADGCLLGNDGYWLAFLRFEARRGGGGAKRVRAVAEQAVAACPHDRAVHAVCAKAVLRQGDADGGFAILDRALEAFAGYDSAQQWLKDEVCTYYVSLRRRSIFGGRFRRLVQQVAPCMIKHDDQGYYGRKQRK